MLKNRKHKILASLLTAGLISLAGIAGVGAPHAHADSFSDSDQKAVAKLCAQKLGISQKSDKKEDQKVIGACQSGYFLGITNPSSSKACDDSYKGDNKALNACKNTGFNMGRNNPLDIKPSGGSGSGGAKAPAAGSCAGSTCSPTPTGSGQNCDGEHCDLINLYVSPAIRLLTILVGLIVTASLIMGGVQYSAAGSDPQKVSAAKSRISNTLLAFFAYAFLYAFLNFLIPGGVFR